MRQHLIAVVLILTVLASAQDQSKGMRKAQPSTHTAASTPAKPKPPQSKSLSIPLDLDQTSLGPDFQGHDITVVVEAIKKSPSLKEKSEFESTAVFEARQAGFIQNALIWERNP